jgi:tRNA threonylcarbamoyladenosine biosynthesis protein TsaE
MTLNIHHLEEINSVASQFLTALGNKKVIAFSGEMGAGKTTFIKALCKALGVLDVASSPTFSLVNEYRSESGAKLYHFDFYRINKESEAMDMGCEEYFYSGNYCFIEWPEKISTLLPSDTLNVTIHISGTSRVLTFQ